MKIRSLEIWAKDEGTGETFRLEKDYDSRVPTPTREQVEKVLHKFLDIVYREGVDEGKKI